MVQLEKYYHLPFGKFIFFDKNGKTTFQKDFTQKFIEKIKILRSNEEHFINSNKAVKFKYGMRKFAKSLKKLEKEIESSKEVMSTEVKCMREISLSLPFRIRKNREIDICLSELKVGIPDTSFIEIFTPFGKEYEIFTQIITLKNQVGNTNILLQYPSGQTFLDYNLNCKRLLNQDLNKGYKTSASARGIYSGSIKVFYRNGQVRHSAIYPKSTTNEEDFPFGSQALEAKDFTLGGKVLVDYSRILSYGTYGKVYNYNKKYFYDDKEKLLSSHLYFDKDKAEWQELTYFHPNGNIKKKITKKDRKLHDWQELYNQAGELIVKEKFEEGKSVEFIKY